MTACISIGYQGKSLEELCVTLSELGCEVLVDVRERAWSQRPEFRKGRLSSALEQSGIHYLHWKALGNPFRPRKGEKIDADQCLRRYAEHLSENLGEIEALSQLAEGSTIAIFCYERDHYGCHRAAVFEALGKVAEISIISSDAGGPHAFLQSFS